MTTPPPAATPMLPVQAAVYERLTGDAELMALVTGGVHDGPPEHRTWPWVDIGEAIETPLNAHDRLGAETVISLHIWTKHRGHSPGLTIAARIMQLLVRQPLTVAEHRHISTRYEFGQTLRDPEPPGDIRHVIQRYRITTAKSPA